MMKYSKWHLQMIICGVFILLGSRGFVLAAEESRWSFVGFTKYRDALFIDKAHLRRPSPGTVLVSARIEPAAKSLLRKSIQREIPQDKNKAKNFKYLILEMEMSCRSHRMRILKLQFCSAAGKIIHTAADPEAAWKTVGSGSLWKDLEGAVCL
jgi:hypothetical protein